MHEYNMTDIRIGEYKAHLDAAILAQSQKGDKAPDGVEAPGDQRHAEHLHRYFL